MSTISRLPDTRILKFATLILAMQLSIPLNAQPVAGDWEGALSLPNGSLRIVFHITSDDDGNLSSTLDSPDQGATGIPVASTSFEDGKVVLNVTAVAGKYEGTLNEDGQRISGLWSQGGATLPLDVKRTDEPAEVNRPQEPQRPFPYDEEEVFFDNEADGARLAGTLTLPKSAGPHPAVVLISGSGPQDRDEALMGHKPFLVLSDYLTRRGVAVLRYDDRGTAKSTGVFTTATSEDLAKDAQAAVDFLKTRSEIDKANIGLAGHSEGGLIAPMLAADPNNVAFIVLLAGPGLAGHELLRLQSERIARAGGMSDELIEQTLYVNGLLYETAMRAPENELEDRLRKSIAQVKEELDAATLRSIGLIEGREEQLVKQLSSPWIRYFLKYNPVPVLQKVKVPVLSVIGEKDLQVPAEENNRAIEQALREARVPFEASILPGLNHLFQTATTGAPSEYAKIEETFAPAALEAIGDWILAQTKS